MDFGVPFFIGWLAAIANVFINNLWVFALMIPAGFYIVWKRDS